MTGDGIAVAVAFHDTRHSTLVTPQHRAQNIWPRFIFARAKTITDFFSDQISHRLKTFNKFSQQRRARRRDQFMRFVALRNANAARAENGQRRRRRNRKSSVCAIHPTRAFDDRRRKHTRLAQQFQREARAHNVHDGIHCADFMEMHAGRRQTVDFALGFGDASGTRPTDFFFTHFESRLREMSRLISAKLRLSS